MDKYDYNMAIIGDLRGTTGLQFQFKLQKVLSRYYKALDKKYEMPSPYGGDDKNDGWVIEDAIFYQVFAPTQIRKSFGKEMQQKFKEDLIGLVKKIKDGKWNGKINKFVFITNTFDTPLPKDPERFYHNCAEKVMVDFGMKFDYRVDNLDYVHELLTNISDLDVLMDIASVLKVKNTIPVSSITERMLLDTMEIINSNMNEKILGGLNFADYKRISTIEKIHVNQLGDKEAEIELFLKHLDVVENTVEIINQDITCSNMFERVINLVICKYKLLSAKFKGIELWENLCKEIQKYSPGEGFTGLSAKLLVVFIFDKCDIFEKKEGG